jgi:hypothetical protein
MKIWIVIYDDGLCCCSTSIAGVFTDEGKADDKAKEVNGYVSEWDENEVA